MLSICPSKPKRISAAWWQQDSNTTSGSPRGLSRAGFQLGQVEEQGLFGHLKQSHTSLWTLLCQCNVGFCEQLCRML